MFQPAYNTTNGPVVVDDAGRTIGGHDFGAVDSTSQVVQSAVNRGDLTLVDSTSAASKNSDQRAQDAARRAADYADRSSRLNAMTREELNTFCRENGLLADDEDDMNKPDIVGLLVAAVEYPLPIVATPPQSADLKEK